MVKNLLIFCFLLGVLFSCSSPKTQVKQQESVIIDGEKIVKYDNGKIREEGNYEVGKKQGDWKYYNENGELFLTITYNFDKEVKFDNVKIKPELIDN